MLLSFHFDYKMEQIKEKIKKEEEKKKLTGGEEKKAKPGNLSHDPSVDEYVLFYHKSWQPGVPEHLYKVKALLKY